MLDSQQQETSNPAKKVLQSCGMREEDIPGGLLVFNGMLWLEWAGTFGICLRYAPLRSFLRTQSGKKTRAFLKHNFRSYPRIERFCNDVATRTSKNKYFKLFPRAFGLEPTNVTHSLAESTFLYNLAFLVWLPMNGSVVWWIYGDRNMGLVK